jgi:hypothetical protein
VGAAAPANASEATVTTIAVRESFISFSISCLQFAPHQRLAMEIRMMRAMDADEFRIHRPVGRSPDGAQRNPG